MVFYCFLLCHLWSCGFSFFINFFEISNLFSETIIFSKLIGGEIRHMYHGKDMFFKNEYIHVAYFGFVSHSEIEKVRKLEDWSYTHPFLLTPFSQISKFWQGSVELLFLINIVILHDFPLDNKGKAIFYMSNFKLEVLKNNSWVWEKLSLFLPIHLDYRFSNVRAKILKLQYSGFSGYPT